MRVLGWPLDYCVTVGVDTLIELPPVIAVFVIYFECAHRPYVVLSSCRSNWRINDVLEIEVGDQVLDSGFLTIFFDSDFEICAVLGLEEPG